MIDLFNTSVVNRIKSSCNKTVLITDDGHGWYTPGKRSTDGSLRENEFNSIVEGKLMFLLDYCGIEHYQLSPAHEDTELNERADLEHEIYYKAKSEGKRVIGISIHCDAWTSPGANGFAVHYFKEGDRYSKEGKMFARCMADSIIQSDRINNHVITPRHLGGIIGNNFYVLRETLGFWILIENGFMTNPDDLRWLKDDSFRNHRALAMLEGALRYIQL